MIRKATENDIRAVAQIYDEIHSAEEAGRLTIGWKRSVYPTEETARSALEAGSLYVAEEDGRIAATAKIDQIQPPAYAEANWNCPSADRDVLVLHTLVVSPGAMGRNLGREFVRYYEQLAAEMGCSWLRIDTNARNQNARRFYSALGYREVGIVPCVFNGLPDVMLVCLEKKVGG